MPEDEQKLMYQLLAASFGTIVEGKPFSESLKETGILQGFEASDLEGFLGMVASKFGVDIGEILDQLGISDIASLVGNIGTLGDLFQEFDGKFDETNGNTYGKREQGSKLYVVKRVLCEAADADRMANAISEEATDKFEVVRLIGSDAEEIGYRLDEPGLEICLAFAKTPEEAVEFTASNKDSQVSNNTLASHPIAVGRADRLITRMLYNHAPEDVEVVLNLLDAPIEFEQVQEAFAEGYGLRKDALELLDILADSGDGKAGTLRGKYYESGELMMEGDETNTALSLLKDIAGCGLDVSAEQDLIGRLMYAQFTAFKAREASAEQRTQLYEKACSLLTAALEIEPEFKGAQKYLELYQKEVLVKE